MSFGKGLLSLRRRDASAANARLAPACCSSPTSHSQIPASFNVADSSSTVYPSDVPMTDNLIILTHRVSDSESLFG